MDFSTVKPLERLVRFLFWHSLVFTLSTPLTRWWRNKWLYVVTVPAAVGESDATFEAYPATEKLDKAWIPHALFGLLWLLSGSAQFLITPNMKARAHKIFGYVSLVVFVGHMVAAGNNLIFNAMDHTFINRLLLLNDLTEGSLYIAKGMMNVFKKRQGWLQEHKDNMFLGFVTTIEGAGTIRTIAFVHYLMTKLGVDKTSLIWKVSGAGIQDCLATHKTAAGVCARPYTMRMIWIRFLTNIYVSHYATFTPSVKEHASERWTSWMITMSILTYAGDQNIPHETAFTVVFAASAWHWGYVNAIFDTVGKLFWKMSAPDQVAKARVAPKATVEQVAEAKTEAPVEQVAEAKTEAPVAQAAKATTPKAKTVTEAPVPVEENRVAEAMTELEIPALVRTRTAPGRKRKQVARRSARNSRARKVEQCRVLVETLKQLAKAQERLAMLESENVEEEDTSVLDMVPPAIRSDTDMSMMSMDSSNENPTPRPSYDPLEMPKPSRRSSFDRRRISGMRLSGFGEDVMLSRFGEDLARTSMRDFDTTASSRCQSDNDDNLSYLSDDQGVDCSDGVHSLKRRRTMKYIEVL